MRWREEHGVSQSVSQSVIHLVRYHPYGMIGTIEMNLNSQVRVELSAGSQNKPNPTRDLEWLFEITLKRWTIETVVVHEYLCRVERIA